MFELLLNGSKDQDDENVFYELVPLHIMCTSLIEFALVQLEILEYEKQQSGSLRFVTEHQIKEKLDQQQHLIKALIFHESKKLELRGFMQTLFDGDDGLTRRQFMENIQHPSCSWIFDVEQIRAKKELFERNNAMDARS